MRILVTKLTDDRHRLAVLRDDGTRDEVELETRSFLLHDVVHYAVEAEAGIEDGFYGSLARGTTLAALSDRTMASSAGLALAESLVGPMQSVWNERLDAARYVELARTFAPHVASAELVDRVRERLRALTGHFRATRFGETMELAWPPEPIRAARSR